MNVEQLVITHMNLANSLAWKKFQKTPLQISFDELQSAAYLGLVKAANKYDFSKKVPFLPYAKLRIIGEMKDYLRTLSWGSRSQNPEVVFFENQKEDFQMLDFIESYDPSNFELFDKIGNKLGDELKQILIWRFVDNLSLKEIGQRKNVTSNYIFHVIKKNIKTIKEIWKKEDLYLEIAA